MIKVMIISFWTNLILTISKIIVGTIGFNHALVADGIASFSDMITDILAIIGGFFSKKHADKNHPFGYGKVEYLSSLCVGIIVIILGVYVLFNLTLDINSTPLLYTLLFTVAFIIIKLILVKYLFKMGTKLSSDIILDSMLESKNDMYGTILVLVSTSLMFLSNYIPIFKYSDFVASIIISILIFRTGIIIISHNISELINTNFKGTLNKEVKEIILSNKEIDSINKLFIFRYGTYYQLLAKVVFKDDIHISLANDIIKKIEKDLKSKKIKYIFIEIDSKEENEKNTNTK